MRRLVSFVIAGVLLAATSGCYQLTQARQASEAQAIAHETAANNGVKAEVLQTILALEEYAVDHDGAYPTRDEFVTALAPYLPDGMMPANPWVPAGLRQGDGVGVGQHLAPAGEPPTPVGTLLGAGQLASSSRFAPRTFGAVVYDYDAQTHHYVIYGIGRRGAQAIVTYAWTNAHP